MSGSGKNAEGLAESIIATYKYFQSPREGHPRTIKYAKGRIDCGLTPSAVIPRYEVRQGALRGNVKPGAGGYAV